MNLRSTDCNADALTTTPSPRSGVENLLYSSSAVLTKRNRNLNARLLTSCMQKVVGGGHSLYRIFYQTSAIDKNRINTKLFISSAGSVALCDKAQDCNRKITSSMFPPVLRCALYGNFFNLVALLVVKRIAPATLVTPQRDRTHDNQYINAIFVTRGLKS